MFRPVGETTSFTSLDLHPSNALSHRFVLQGLEKFTSYQVVVQAYNKQGLGPASTAAVATTTEDGKSCSDLGMSLDSKSADQVTSNQIWPF